MTGTTPGDGLRYPNDYQQPADSPNAFQQLATDTQAALNRHVDKVGDTMTGPLNVPAINVGEPFLTAAASGPTYNGTIWNRNTGPIQTRYQDGTLIPLRTAPGVQPDEAVVMSQVGSHPAGLVPPSNWVGDGQLSCVVWAPGTLAAGAEAQSSIYGINPGTFVFVTVQHSSTYLIAVWQDLGDGTGYAKVRNSTTSTPHSNVKVHLLFVNPPAA